MKIVAPKKEQVKFTVVSTVDTVVMTAAWEGIVQEWEYACDTEADWMLLEEQTFNKLVDKINLIYKEMRENLTEGSIS